jgi:hypothetical protein
LNTKFREPVVFDATWIPIKKPPVEGGKADFQEVVVESTYLLTVMPGTALFDARRAKLTRFIGLIAGLQQFLRTILRILSMAALAVSRYWSHSSASSCRWVTREMRFATTSSSLSRLRHSSRSSGDGCGPIYAT